MIDINKARELYKKVQQKKEDIQKAELGNYSTDGYFRFSQGGQIKDIKTIRQKLELVEMLAFLKSRSRDLEESAKALNYNGDITWLGAKTSDWENDLLLRGKQIDLNSSRQELFELESKLKLLSPELLAEIEMEAIEKALA